MTRSKLTHLNILSREFKESIQVMSLDELHTTEERYLKLKKFDEASYVNRIIVLKKANMGVRYAGSSK